MTEQEDAAFNRAMTQMCSTEEWATRLGISPEDLRRRFKAAGLGLLQVNGPPPAGDPWHTGARVELKRRLDLQLYDFKYSLGHSTANEAWNGAGLVMGSIHEMQEYGLLTAEEVAVYQAQVRSAYAAAQPDELYLFDDLWMWDPLNHD